MGSEAERYLRVLQVAAKAPLYPWTLRGILPGQLGRVLPKDQDHPWADQLDFSLDGPSGFQGGWVVPEAGVILNSSYPFGENDGARWVGRGITGVLKGGAFFRFGRLHVRIAPEVFWGQNSSFDLAPNRLIGEGAFRDGVEPEGIDHPQRFGEGAYGRIDLGSSSVNLEFPGITFGVSGAGQQWGPAIHYPLLLGNNAGGFLRLFLQTSDPVNLGIAKIQGQLSLGRLDQSDLSPVEEGESRRFISGAVLVATIRGLEGMELGAGRIAEGIWPESGIGHREMLRPFVGIVQGSSDPDNVGGENQLASAFFRWVLPKAQVEVFGELLWEDFARDFRFFLEEPDDLLSRAFGLQKVWTRSGGQLIALRWELVSSEVHHSERMDRFSLPKWVPRPLPGYVHYGVPQGHTQNGQILGSPTAYGGSGWTLGVDVFDETGRTSMDLSRALRTDWLWIHSGTVGPGVADVIYAFKFEVVRFKKGYRWTATFNPSVDLNRNVEEGNDVWNLGVGFSVRGLPW